ncbi:MAG TPA: hypothetical protein PKJ41_10415 [Bryobacteraceae bacterium]|nr:hypothetical protein [Bryobacteraceae bacterium]HPT25975.1 hypothetical protein [Bryobacteraceae bacterium]
MPRKPPTPRKTAAPARRKAVTRRVAAGDARCVVCGDPVAPFSTEELCWVCRRLKISAWRESDTQAALQE